MFSFYIALQYLHESGMKVYVCSYILISTPRPSERVGKCLNALIYSMNVYVCSYTDIMFLYLLHVPQKELASV